MVQLTKQQIVDLYESKKSYQEIQEELSTETVEVTTKMVKGLFDSQGFASKKRPVLKKEKNMWFEIVESPEQDS